MTQTIKTPLAINIRRGFFDHFTPSMLLVTTVLFLMVFMLLDRISEAFHENIPLNSIICGVVLYTMVRAYYNNYRIYRMTRYLKRIEAIEQKGDPDHATIMDLVKRLETDGALINIQNMYSALENLSVYGHLNLSDNDAKLIKSKMGSRIAFHRQAVNFFGGILVMFGLIGTFWGLLITITEVGEAMDEVSKTLSNNAGAQPDMGSFIASISDPLQGMGIAFSASLFGLAGSLFLSLLNFFGHRAQNNVIEDISRWIDNRIPKLNPVLSEKVKKQKVPKSDDLKAWLAGFVYLSSKTNQKMGQIMLALSKSTEAMLKSAYQTEKIYDYQKDIFMATERMSTRMSVITDSVKYITKHIDPVLKYNSTMIDNLGQIRELLHSNLNSNTEINTKQVEKMGTLTNQLHEVSSTFSTLNEIQGSLVKEIEKLRERSQKEDNVAEFSNLVWQLNKILEDIQQKNASAYMGVFDSVVEEETEEDFPGF